MILGIDPLKKWETLWILTDIERRQLKADHVRFRPRMQKSSVDFSVSTLLFYGSFRCCRRYECICFPFTPNLPRLFKGENSTPNFHQEMIICRFCFGTIPHSLCVRICWIAFPRSKADKPSYSPFKWLSSARSATLFRFFPDSCHFTFRFTETSPARREYNNFCIYFLWFVIKRCRLILLAELKEPSNRERCFTQPQRCRSTFYKSDTVSQER
jgi:hypothetical protein